MRGGLKWGVMGHSWFHGVSRWKLGAAKRAVWWSFADRISVCIAAGAPRLENVILGGRGVCNF